MKNNISMKMDWSILLNMFDGKPNQTHVMVYSIIYFHVTNDVEQFIDFMQSCLVVKVQQTKHTISYLCVNLLCVLNFISMI